VVGGKPTVAVSAKIPEPAILRVKEVCNVVHHWDVSDTLQRNDFLNMVSDVDGLLCTLNEKINVELLEKAKKLKIVSTMSVGYDHIDLPECTKRGIKVSLFTLFFPNFILGGRLEIHQEC